jgi:hypothetical protein
MECGEVFSAWVRCKCGAERRESRTKAIAIEKWNTRPGLAQRPHLTIERVEFRNFPGKFTDVPSAFAFTTDGKEWRLSEDEIKRALNAQPIVPICASKPVTSTENASPTGTGGPGSVAADQYAAANAPATPVPSTDRADCKHRIKVTPRNGAPHGAGFACGLSGGHCQPKEGCGYAPVSSYDPASGGK